MAEVSDREYNLLMTAINSNSTSTAALGVALNDLRERVAGRYLTRDEDVQSDNERAEQLYNYVREQLKGVEDAIEQFKWGNKIIQWAVGANFALLGVLISVVLYLVTQRKA
jgi:hypothetical protein